MDDDSQLVARAQAGDPTAFAELVGRYKSKVFRLALSILGKEFVPEAEDVTQEVFLKVHDALQTFRGEAQFGSWVYRIAFNKAVNLKKRVRFSSRHLQDAVLRGVAGSSIGPEGQAAAQQRDRFLEDCIQTLPELYQSALRQHYWLGAGMEEVADSLGVPVNTAKSYLHRARKLLHERLTKRGYSL